MEQNYSFDPAHPELGYMPSIPEPFWERSWRTWFRWRPYCVVCRKLLKDRSDWTIHYALNHIPPVETEG